MRRNLRVAGAAVIQGCRSDVNSKEYEICVCEHAFGSLRTGATSWTTFTASSFSPMTPSHKWKGKNCSGWSTKNGKRGTKRNWTGNKTLIHYNLYILIAHFPEFWLFIFKLIFCTLISASNTAPNFECLI